LGSFSKSEGHSKGGGGDKTLGLSKGVVLMGWGGRRSGQRPRGKRIEQKRAARKNVKIGLLKSGKKG